MAFKTRPLALAAAALVGLEALVAALGGHALLLSVAALLLAPGLALIPLLPDRIARSPVGALAAAPALGFAAASTALITLSSLGVDLTGTSTRLALAAIVLAGFALRGPEPQPWERADLRAAAGLGGALIVGYVLQRQVIGDTPVPGNDWAKYVLYGDEIRNQGALLVDNPFWMLGQPFREDPGGPAVEGAALILAGGPAGVLVHGIWVAALAGIGTVYAFVQMWWGRLAGLLAALFLAVLPISQDILAWHGLANSIALALLPLVLAYGGTLITAGLGPRAAAGFALVLVGLAASHRLSALVTGLALVFLIGIALAGPERRRVLRGAAMTAAFAIPLGAGVAYDLIQRQQTFGGTQGYDAYLSAKVRLGPVASDLSIVFTVLALAAVALAVRRVRSDRALLAPLCLLAAAVLLAFGWIVHIPLPYFRMAYFLPVALVSLVAVALTRLLPARRAAAAGALACAVIAVFAWVQASNVRDFYGFANEASLKGLDAVAATLRPGEAVVTDRCWSFLSTWLLHTPAIAALEPEDIQPEAEVRRAREARAVLDGTPAGLSYARTLGVRYLIVDPTCVDARERPTRPPSVGTPVFLSRRLVVLRLPGA